MKNTKLLLTSLIASLLMTGCASLSNKKESQKCECEVPTHEVIFIFDGDSSIVPKQYVKHGEKVTRPSITRIDSMNREYSPYWLYRENMVTYDEVTGERMDFWYYEWQFEAFPVTKDMILYSFNYD